MFVKAHLYGTEEKEPIIINLDWVMRIEIFHPCPMSDPKLKYTKLIMAPDRAYDINVIETPEELFATAFEVQS